MKVFFGVIQFWYLISSPIQEQRFWWGGALKNTCVQMFIDLFGIVGTSYPLDILEYVVWIKSYLHSKSVLI